MENQKLDFEGRKIRGYAIISKGDSPEHIGHGVYRLPSQSENGVYIITTNRFNTTCTCKDFETRKIKCKHIHAIEFWLSLRKKILSKKEIDIPQPKEQLGCIYCKSERIMKFCRIEGSAKQRYKCKVCKKTFVSDADFRKFKGNPKLITAVMDLYFKGVSLRKIVDHVKQFYGVKITHVTVYYWVKRFTKLMSDYVANLQPQVSNVWHTDEQMFKLKQKDKYVWCWNIIDAETRFLIANNITEGRDIQEARQVFNKSKDVATRPDVVITDGLWSYEKAIEKEFPQAEHIRLAGIAKKVNNNKVERYHDSVREREKSMRGLQNPNTAQNWQSAFRLYYNYLRPHMKFNGLTPAEVAGIKLNLQGNKWEGLLRLSLKNRI